MPTPTDIPQLLARLTFKIAYRLFCVCVRIAYDNVQQAENGWIRGVLIANFLLITMQNTKHLLIKAHAPDND